MIRWGILLPFILVGDCWDIVRVYNDYNGDLMTTLGDSNDYLGCTMITMISWIVGDYLDAIYRELYYPSYIYIYIHTQLYTCIVYIYWGLRIIQ